MEERESAGYTNKEEETRTAEVLYNKEQKLKLVEIEAQIRLLATLNAIITITILKIQLS